MVRIVVVETLQVGPAEHDAVDDAGVGQFVGKYVIAAPGERRYDAGIGKKSAAEDQGLGISFQSGNYPLQFIMWVQGACYQSGSGRPAAIRFEVFTAC